MCRVWDCKEAKRSARFLCSVDYAGASTYCGTPCWQWLGWKDDRGYGRAGFRGKSWCAHRLSYHLFVAPITLGCEIHHKCYNTSCVNPAHLEEVTPLRNYQLRRPSDFLVAIYARNKKKTHCPAGHPYDEKNTYRQKGSRPGRSCKQCRDALNKKFTKVKSIKRSLLRCVLDLMCPLPVGHVVVRKPGHCKRGHPQTEENVYLHNKRSRQCRLCRKDYGAIYRAAKRKDKPNAL